MMYQIYQRATEVKVWLGESEPTDAIAFWTIENLNEWWGLLGPDTEDIVEFFEAVKDDEDEWACACCGEYFLWVWDRRKRYAQAMEALSAFLSKPWFGRLWVLQEAQANKTGTCYAGKHFTSFEHLEEVTRTYADAAIFMEPYCLRMTPARHRSIYTMAIRSAKSSELNPLRVLCNAAAHEASDPRDRVYAILMTGMDSTGHAPGIKPDYQIPASTLWKHLAIRALEELSATRYKTGIDASEKQYGSDDRDSMCSSLLLSLVGTQAENSPDLPSWVPSFDNLTIEAQKKERFYWTHASRRYVGRLRAGEDQMFHATWHKHEPDLLRIRGLFVSKIEEVLPASKCPVIKDETTSRPGDAWLRHVEEVLLPWFFRCRAWIRKCGNLKELLDHNDSQFTTHGYLSVCGSFPIQISKETRSSCSESRYAQIYEDLDRFLDQNATLLTHFDTTRLLARMACGRYGWVPQRGVAGDDMCIFEGAMLPFVLRRRLDG